MDVALLQRQPDGEIHNLAARTLVGRSSACALRIEDGRVSGEHASILWQGGRWVLRDLSSRNGCLLNGAALAKGGSRPLAEGDLLAFGHKDIAFRLTDASEPGALALRAGTKEMRRSEDGVLLLPSEEEPAAYLFEEEQGRWQLQLEEGSRFVRDGEILEIEGQAWLLRVPEPIPPTSEARSDSDTGAPTLRMRVSLDEETVEVLVVTAKGVRSLSPRSHHYTLLTLARLRIAAEERRDLPEEARGWVGVDTLCDMLAVTEARLNVDVYRIRRDLMRAGIADASAAIERRKSSRQLRIAWTTLSVEPLR